MDSIYPKYDVIVVGAGHAGSEAAAASAGLGAKTLLITMNLDAVAKMSCNPAMGGVAKGQLVREIDALGGLSGIVSDKSGVQFRMLNKSKGPAMWSPRCQSDRLLYAQIMRKKLENIPHLTFRQDNVVDILTEKDGKKVKGVTTQTGQTFYSESVILTSGTFLSGLIHNGESQHGGGRSGERASVGISASLEKLGFEVGRLKTGTPPRIDGRSIDFEKLEIQYGDEDPSPFSFMTDSLPGVDEQLTCWIGYTSGEVHDTLKTGFDRSPMFNGRIKSIGPRYCPSIEDKIDRFADKDQHQLFLEPEGWNTYEMYLNGFSTSLPEDVQYHALRKIEGFENAVMLRPGYAIEYDYFPPYQIKRSLETKVTEGLFFAGQINGTTGYEEAACQGLMAGINAALYTQEKEPFILKRSEAYIGVLIDDLINKGTEEPYRMFTSRAEHRILLRQDNADQRLTPKGYEAGLVSEERYNNYKKKIKLIDEALEFLKNNRVTPTSEVREKLEELDSGNLSQPATLEKLLRRPELKFDDIKYFVKELPDYPKEVKEQVEIQVKYKGYIERQESQIEQFKKMENKKIPEDIEYSELENLRIEAREKLDKVKPDSLGQASRISGVSPSDISVLMIYLEKRKQEQ